MSALSTATVATGTPLGICTVERRASNPPKAELLIGTPITGRLVWAAMTPARWAALPAAAIMAENPSSLAEVAKAMTCSVSYGPT